MTDARVVRAQPRRRSAVALLSAWVMSTGAMGQSAAVDAEACPGASAWQAAHVDRSAQAVADRDQRRPLSKAALLAELQARVGRDQDARKKLLTAPLEPAYRREVARVDAENLKWLLLQLKSDGLPTADQVGEHGLQLVWLLVQHADRAPDLQAIALGEFRKRFESGELSAESLAKLTDRVLIGKGESQRYGTQFDWSSGRFEPKGNPPTVDVDRNRATLGLMPLSDYACLMNSVLRRGKGVGMGR